MIQFCFTDCDTTFKSIFDAYESFNIPYKCRVYEMQSFNTYSNMFRESIEFGSKPHGEYISDDHVIVDLHGSNYIDVLRDIKRCAAKDSNIICLYGHNYSPRFRDEMLKMLEYHKIGMTPDAIDAYFEMMRYDSGQSILLEFCANLYRYLGGDGYNVHTLNSLDELFDIVERI